MKTLLVDTRETTPWDFNIFGWENKVHYLEEGDYTTQKILDVEIKKDIKVCRIERKSTVSELAGNLGKNFSRFEKEMERLEQYRNKIIVLEFDVDDVLAFPHNTKMKKKYRSKVRMNGKFMLSRLGYLDKRYGMKIYFSSCREEAMSIAKDLLENIENSY